MQVHTKFIGREQ